MASKSVGGLWRAVERELGFSVPPAARRFCQRRGWVGDWEQAEGNPKERSDTFRNILDTCRDMHATGLIDAPSNEAIVPVVADDGRWELMRELRNDPDFQHVRIYQPPVLELSTSSVKPAPQSLPVRIEFDGRLALSALIAELRAAWPEMKRRGWIVQSRPLEARMLALIRHVCLDSEPGTSWGKLRASWNERHPEWGYKNGQALAKAFHKAETALSKEVNGLEVHYNPWATADIRQVKRAARAGDQRARRYLERRLNLWERGLEALAAIDDEGNDDDGE